MSLSSTITVSAAGVEPGQSISVPVGTRITVRVDVAPDELIPRSLYLAKQMGAGWNTFRAVRPGEETNRHLHAYYRDFHYYQTGEATSFQLCTLNVLPGTYRLEVRGEDIYGNQLYADPVSDAYIYSGAFTITSGLSDDLVPDTSNSLSLAQLHNRIVESVAVADPAVLAFFDEAGQKLSALETGQWVAMAVNIRGLAEVNNLVDCRLTLSDDSSGVSVSLFKIFPFSQYVNPENFVATPDLDGAYLVDGVWIRHFYVPPHLSHTSQAGSLGICVDVRKYSDVNSLPPPPTYVPPDPPGAVVDDSIEVVLPLLDDAARLPVEENVGQLSITGHPHPLQTWKVKWVFIGADIPVDHFQAWAQELRDFIDNTTKGWFAVEVEAAPIYLSDLPIDYASWWLGLPKDATGSDLDPSNPDDLFVIRHIYALENSLTSPSYMETVHAPGASGEDLTVYTYFNDGTSGGASPNNHTAISHVGQPWFEGDYVNDNGEYKAPTLGADPQTRFAVTGNRNWITNLTAHELMHTLCKRPIRNTVGHVNGYRISEAPAQDDRRYWFAQHLLDRDANEKIGWKDTLMSSYRNRLANPAGILDEQLAPMIARYQPPGLQFRAKLSGAPPSEASDRITVRAGSSVDMLLEAKSVSGLGMMWYFQASVERMWGYGSLDSFARVYEASETHTRVFPTPGTFEFQANCRDILYYLPHGGTASNARTIGYPHQASEAGGLQKVTVEVKYLWPWIIWKIRQWFRRFFRL